jgi:hypothetical protein
VITWSLILNRIGIILMVMNWSLKLNIFMVTEIYRCQL